jgi:hypothetical protein
MLLAAFPQPAKMTMYVVWHLCTIVLLLSAAALLSAGLRLEAQHRPLLLLIGAEYSLFTVLFIAVGLLQFGPEGLLALPQWTLLGPIAALTLFAARHSRTIQGA